MSGEGQALVAARSGHLKETMDYIRRVDLLGGKVYNPVDVDIAIRDAKDNGYYDNIKIWLSAQFGTLWYIWGIYWYRPFRWFDLSPNNNDATCAYGSTNSPTFVTGVKNGKAGILWNGSLNKMNHTWSASGNTTMVAVLKGDDAGQTGQRHIWGASAGGAVLKLMYARTDADVWGTYHNIWLKSSYSVYGTWRIVMMKDDGVSANPNQTYLYTNGEAVEDKTATSRYSDGNDRRAIGQGSAADGTTYFKGYILELIGLDTQLGDTERNALLSRLNAMYGIY